MHEDTAGVVQAALPIRRVWGFLQLPKGRDTEGLLTQGSSRSLRGKNPESTSLTSPEPEGQRAWGLVRGLSSSLSLGVRSLLRTSPDPVLRSRGTASTQAMHLGMGWLGRPGRERWQRTNSPQLLILKDIKRIVISKMPLIPNAFLILTQE